MPIEATTPTVVQPAPAPVTYDKWWVWSYVTDASDPTAVRVQATLKKYRQSDDGSPAFSPVDPAVNIAFAFNMLDPADPSLADPNVQLVMGAMLQGLSGYGREKGLL